MSDIYGSGHGSKHNWHSGFTGANKGTPYQCDCGASFVHWYDETPDIFQAMLEAGVPEECAAAETGSAGLHPTTGQGMPAGGE